MPPERYDLDQPVELRLRGDAIDVFGALMAVLAPALEEGTGGDRTDTVLEDVSDAINRQVNLGWYKREATRAISAGAVPDYRGIQLLVDEFDAQRPELTGAAAERMTPLDEAERYVVVSLTEEGLESGGYPDSMTELEMLEMASMLRIYARDLENAVTENEIDLREADDEA